VPAWAWAAASCRGTSHVKSGTQKQDAFTCFVAPGGFLVSLVSDGAGSASHGGEGASLVCRTFATALRRHFEASSVLPDDQALWQWLDGARDRIGIAASRRNLTPRDFAATIVLAITDGTAVLVAHVGDGSSVARHADTGTWTALSWPAQGEYASTTFFVTDDPVPELRIIRLNQPIDALATFTDGIERLALDYALGDAHQPFFRGMIAPLANSGVLGRDDDLTGKLAVYLDSPAVCGRTDDDKTLILAVRR